MLAVAEPWRESRPVPAAGLSASFLFLLEWTDKRRKQCDLFKTSVSHFDLVSFFIVHVCLGNWYAAGSSPHNSMSELKDCPPLKYYDFKPVEHVKLCPRYTAVLGRSEDDGIGIEELDTLQLELETLLSSASRRLRALEEQRQVGNGASSGCTQDGRLCTVEVQAQSHNVLQSLNKENKTFHLRQHKLL